MSSTAPLTPDQLQELVQQTSTLMLAILQSAAGYDHAVALSALISAYVNLLERHPCCHASQAHALHHLALRFARVAQQEGVNGQAPASPHVH